MRIRATPRPLIGAVLAVTLVAAACGSEPANTLEAAANGTTTSQAGQPDQDAEATEPSELTEAPAGDDQAAEGNDAEASETTEAPLQHLFPDLDTVNVADGSTLNLADELAGGDTPVLLWFYAPH